MMLSNHLILCCPCLLLPLIFLSIRIFSNESAFLIRWPKHWSVSFSISPSREHSGLNSFRIDWFDLLVVQWTLKSLPQLHNSKALILWGSTFFIVHLPYPYMTTEKNHSFDCVDLYQQIDVSAFESRVCHSFPSKEQMSFNFMAAVILEPKKIKSVTAYPWLNYKYKIFRTAVEVYHKTPGQECSQTSRKNFTNHQNYFSCPFLFLWIFLSQCKLVCTRISLISQATIKYILNEKCT